MLGRSELRGSRGARMEYVAPGAAARYGTGMRGFFAWLRVKSPPIYRAVSPKIRNPQLAGLGFSEADAQVPVAQANTGPTAPSIADRIKDIVFGVSQAYLTAEQLKAQKKILDLQLQRAQQGLPPLDINMQSYGFGPQATVGLSSDTKTLLMWGGAALAAVYLVPKLLRR